MKKLKAYRVTVGTTSLNTTYGPGKKTYRECKEYTILFITYDPREIYDEFPLAESITEIGLGYIGDVAFSREDPQFLIDGEPARLKQNTFREDPPIGISPSAPVQDLEIVGYACPGCHGPVELRSSHRSGEQKKEWFICAPDDREGIPCSINPLFFTDSVPPLEWLKSNQEDKGND